VLLSKGKCNKILLFFTKKKLRVGLRTKADEEPILVRPGEDEVHGPREVVEEDWVEPPATPGPTLPSVAPKITLTTKGGTGNNPSSRSKFLSHHSPIK
jgi:hypothetical protein